MEHSKHAPDTAANGGCYQCTSPNNVVVFDNPIEGEGVLVICGACIRDANRIANMGKAQIAREEKAAQRRQEKKEREWAEAREAAAEAYA